MGENSQGADNMEHWQMRQEKRVRSREDGFLRTHEIRHVANQPNDQKAHGQAISALRLVVCEQLGKLFCVDKHGQSTWTEKAGKKSRDPRSRDLREQREGRTRRHIHAVKLMLPKIPDRASSTFGVDDKAAKAVTATEAIVCVISICDFGEAHNNEREG